MLYRPGVCRQKNQKKVDFQVFYRICDLFQSQFLGLRAWWPLFFISFSEQSEHTLFSDKIWMQVYRG